MPFKKAASWINQVALFLKSISSTLHLLDCDFIIFTHLEENALVYNRFNAHRTITDLVVETECTLICICFLISFHMVISDM